MKKTILFIFFLTLVSKCDCFAFFNKLDQTDTTIKKIQNSSLRVLKYNPIQIAFGEIPVSWEVFKGEKESIQFQIGILFPFLKRYSGYFFPPSSNLISCRTMPFFSYGISSKIELRKYGKKSYYALQGMYKYSAYNNVSFTIWDSDPTYESFDQIESKSSHIIGLGFMIGRQSYYERSATDKYMGFGVRLRIFDGVIKAQEFGSPAGRIEMNRHFNYSSIYPFVNFGIRFGRTFLKTKTSNKIK